MTHRQDWLLQKIGITQYELRKPSALKGEFTPQINTNTRLIIVSDEGPCRSDPCLADILLAMQLNQAQLDYITSEKLALLTPVHPICFWFIGTEIPINLQQYCAPIIKSDCWNTLCNDPLAKRQLWQTIYKNEHYFSIEHS